MSINDLISKIDALLPQTQCKKCGYDGCLPYAEAIQNKQESINKCSPGGEKVINFIAKLLNVKSPPVDENCKINESFKVAIIDENHCIGCTICIQACPVDAIIGTKKRMHTVLNDWCTGCELCVEPCPVDCIDMISISREWTKKNANVSRARYLNRQFRLKSKTHSNKSLMKKPSNENLQKNSNEISSTTYENNKKIL
ncbi:MAG: electron transport complex subunit RsxB [Bordetella sp.]|nr:MAG: electron transport complex subunit RsxB [Bordetella sp.]